MKSLDQRGSDVHRAPFARELHTATIDVLKPMPDGQAAFGMGCDALRQIELHGCRRSARRMRAQLHNGAIALALALAAATR